MYLFTPKMAVMVCTEYIILKYIIDDKNPEFHKRK